MVLLFFGDIMMVSFCLCSDAAIMVLLLFWCYNGDIPSALMWSLWWHLCFVALVVMLWWIYFDGISYAD